ncbi:variant erythrocyte surface antigen-1 family protein [Babesia caballi]|uniref:Variant erythrocyte surface antigen-1 family protein n=1 Tax=Babesia caballi TaxID=5871 RepID=A0AAV4M3Q6_BABCB|nr:variant erythrocyte surface antigen-1 family protein [Babesia caballi]
MLPLDIPLSAHVDLSSGCPSKLKEAIDWILRVTGKDGGGIQNGTKQLATAVNNLISKAGIERLKPQITINQGLINSLATGLATFIGYKDPDRSNSIGNGGIAVGQYGGTGKPWNPGEASGRGYRLTYHRTSATWDNSFQGGDNSTTAAKIFLGCVPMIFSALSYLYWRCDDSKGNGEWSGFGLTGSGSASHLKDFMVGLGYSSNELNGSKLGSQIASSAFSGLVEFKTAASSLSTTNSPYVSFAAELHKKVRETSGSFSTTCPLSALYHGASCYFRCEQTKVADKASRGPKTIREMLYFLAALHFSPQYDGLEKHIKSLFNNGPLDVADSGLQTTKNKLSADQIQEYLTASCSLSPAVLGTLQGGDETENSDPWLHELFCNSAFQFKYTSGAILFSTLANYTYALQFQLHFLYQQCQNDYRVGCGWRHCRFGKGINSGSANSPPSHICNGYTCKDRSKCTHDGNGTSANCNHNKNGVPTCGKSGNLSPLQAFLTDNLHGFSRGHPSDPSSHLATCSGFLCHVPMGFKAEDLRSSPNANTQGENICLTLRPFCGGFNTPLRQLCEKLGCLTKRTPRTLGDVFGFLWHLNGQLFGNKKPAIADIAKKIFESITSQSGSHKVPHFFLELLKQLGGPQVSSSSSPNLMSLSFESMAPAIPFLYHLFMAKDSNSLPGTLFDLNQHCHKREVNNKAIVGGRTNTITITKHNGDVCSTANDLWSLYQPVKPKPTQNNDTDPYKDCRNGDCGPYLYPLTHSDGATYAPRHASTYFSWVLYLSDDLQSWFQYMLDEFKNIDCKALGCVKCTEGTHKSGEHGEESKCKCDSVVQCGGTLPLLYRHGFRYFNPFVLMGGQIQSGNVNYNGETKRSCHQFADQLQSVTSGNPLSTLLTAIDTFLYAIRWEFFSKLSGFWTIYICLILYTFFFLLDTLRVRSHLHFPSSNSIQPVSLLTTAKAPALKKFTKLTYFMP